MARHAHDTAWQGHDIGNDTAGPRTGQVARAAKGLAAGSWVAIQNCIMTGARA